MFQIYIITFIPLLLSLNWSIKIFFTNSLDGPSRLLLTCDKNYSISEKSHKALVWHKVVWRENH